MISELAHTTKVVPGRTGCHDVTDVFLEIGSLLGTPWDGMDGVHLPQAHSPPHGTSGGGLWLNLPLKGAPRALTTPPKYAPMGVAGPDPAAQWREGFVPVRVANADHSLWGTLCIEGC